MTDLIFGFRGHLAEGLGLSIRQKHRVITEAPFSSGGFSDLTIAAPFNTQNHFISIAENQNTGKVGFPGDAFPCGQILQEFVDVVASVF